jgi:hypothetical protein
MVSREFLTAGKAIFTIECPAAFSSEQLMKPHYTFRVRFKKGTNGYADALFIDLLVGPDNSHDYRYLGIISQDGTLRTTAKSCQEGCSKIVKLVARVLRRIWDGDGDKIEAAGFKVHHEGTCGRCGRLLTVPESVESGIGPECAKRMRCGKPKVEKATFELSQIQFELSERPGFDLSSFSAHRDQEGEVTHWTGKMNGTQVTVLND